MSHNPPRVVHLIRYFSAANEGGAVRDRAFYLHFRQFSWIKTVTLGKYRLLNLFKLARLFCSTNHTFLLHISSTGLPILNNGLIGRIAVMVYISWLRKIAKSNRVFLEFNDLFVEQAMDLSLDIPKNFEKGQKAIFAIPNIKYVFASESMQNYARKRYNLKNEETLAIPNGEFPTTLISDKNENDRVSKPLKFVYAGTLNKGRAIEELLKVFAHKEAELTLIGAHGEWISKDYALPNNIKYMPAMPADQLLPYLKTFDIGLIPYPAEREYYQIAYPTKLSTYLMAGIPFLSTPVAEAQHVLKRYPAAGFCLPLEKWPEFVTKSRPQKIRVAKQKISSFSKDFSWGSLFMPLEDELRDSKSKVVRLKKPMYKPRVTVLMPAYNAAHFIREAITSILDQSFTDFELIVIDDGSTDATAQIIGTFQDSRLRLVRNKKNLGIVRTLNKGLALAKGEYIARMDADDYALPQRLATQVHFLDMNPDITVIGTDIEDFSSTPKKSSHRIPTDPREIRTRLLFHCVLMHPTIMMRTSTIRKNRFQYEIRHKHVEDFGLWQKMSFSHKLANLPVVLLRYRAPETSVTKIAERNIAERDAAHILVYQQALAQHRVHANPSELIALRLLLGRRSEISVKQIQMASLLLGRLRANLDPTLYDLGVFNDMVARHFLSVIRNGFNKTNRPKIAVAIEQSLTFRKYGLLSIPGIVQTGNAPVLGKIICGALATLLAASNK